MAIRCANITAHNFPSQSNKQAIIQEKIRNEQRKFFQFRNSFRVMLSSSSPQRRGLNLDLRLDGPMIPRRSRIVRDSPVVDSPSFRPPENIFDSGDSIHPSVTLSQYQQFQALYKTPEADSKPNTSELYFSQYTQPETNSSSNLRASQLPKKLKYLESQCEIEFDQLKFVNRLGEGAFGEVWRGCLWDLDVAIKKLKGNFLRASPLEELADEVALLK